MKSDRELISDIKHVGNTIRHGGCARGSVFVNRYQLDTETWYSISQNYPVVGSSISCDDICPRCADPNVKSRRGYETCICIHAEIVSLLQDFKPSYMVVSRYPCMQCLISIVYDSRIVELIIIIDKDEAVDQELIDAMDVVISRADMDIRVIDVREGDEKVSILRSTGKRQDDAIKSDGEVFRWDDNTIGPILTIGGVTTIPDTTFTIGSGTTEILTQEDITIPRINEANTEPIILDPTVEERIRSTSRYWH